MAFVFSVLSSLLCFSLQFPSGDTLEPNGLGSLDLGQQCTVHYNRSTGAANRKDASLSISILFLGRRDGLDAARLWFVQLSLCKIICHPGYLVFPLICRSTFQCCFKI